MEFHYKEYHDILSVECPPKSYKSEETCAYRWVSDDIEESNNFIPQYHKKPRRFNDKSDHKKCVAMSLSLYKDVGSAVERFVFFKEEQGMGERAFTILGRCIAEGILNENDGVNERKKSGEVIETGHFSHHPALDYDYVKKFKIIASFI